MHTEIHIYIYIYIHMYYMYSRHYDAIATVGIRDHNVGDS